jgi:hypothetical protein
MCLCNGGTAGMATQTVNLLRKQEGLTPSPHTKQCSGGGTVYTTGLKPVARKGHKDSNSFRSTNKVNKFDKSWLNAV